MSKVIRESADQGMIKLMIAAIHPF